MEPRVSIVSLGETDLQRSIRFYRDGLGLPMREGNEGIAFFETKGTWLGLYPWDTLAEDAGQNPRGEGFRGFTLAHNVMSKDEVDTLISKIPSIGGEVIKEPQDADWGGYSGYFSDPDGFLWEVAWNPYFPID